MVFQEPLVRCLLYFTIFFVYTMAVVSHFRCEHCAGFSCRLFFGSGSGALFGDLPSDCYGGGENALLHQVLRIQAPSRPSLQPVQSVHRAHGPSLSVGEQLHWVPQHEVLRPVPGVRCDHVLSDVCARLLQDVRHVSAHHERINLGCVPFRRVTCSHRGDHDHDEHVVHVRGFRRIDAERRPGHYSLGYDRHR